MPLRVTTLTPKVGGAFQLGRFSVLVGPNNCGKSQTLKDIKKFISSGSIQQTKIFNEIGIDIPPYDEAMYGLQVRPHEALDHLIISGVANDLKQRHESTVYTPRMMKAFEDPRSDIPTLLGDLGQFWSAHLDAEGRFRLAAPSDSYDTRSEAPSNALQAFFEGGMPAVEELRTVFRSAFDTDIALDWAAMRKLYLRVASDFGVIPDDRTSLNTALANAEDLAQQGDGYRSFAGVVLAMLTFPNRVLLLDEPEAFLHPMQARVLGRWLASHSHIRAAQVVVASHSADFLWGVVSANADANIVRLNRTEAGTSFHNIPASVTNRLMQSPLLSSQPVLDALFHKGVVICEGDPDRAIYQTVAERNIENKNSKDILFIHSNGKDSAKIPLELLRESGTPACVVLDIDVINSKQVLEDLVLAGTGSPASSKVLELRESVARMVEAVSQQELLDTLNRAVAQWQLVGHTDLRSARRSLVASAREGSSGWEGVKKVGLDYFDEQTRAVAEELLSELKNIGVFVVPCGELESWMALNLAKGSRWNRAALEALYRNDCPPPLREFVQSICGHFQG